MEAARWSWAEAWGLLSISLGTELILPLSGQPCGCQWETPQAAHPVLPSASVGRGDGNLGAEKSCSSAVCRVNHTESFSWLVKSACVFSASLARGLFTKLGGDLPLCNRIFKLCPKDPGRDFTLSWSVCYFLEWKSRWVLLLKIVLCKVTLSAFLLWVSKVWKFNLVNIFQHDFLGLFYQDQDTSIQVIVLP